MSGRARLAVFLAAAGGLAALLVWAFIGLPRFGSYHGPYGNVIRAVAVHQRHATNVVDAVVFDYRAIDTVGEEFIFFAAVVGIAMLLRAQREEAERPAEDHARRRRLHPTSDAVRVAGLALVGPFALFGMYLVVHGHVTPGGGFQGGVVLAGAPVMIYLAGRYEAFRSVAPMPLIDFEEGAGAAGFVIVGLVGVAAGGAFLQNVFPLGRIGALFSGGTLPVINLSVGLEVAAGVVIVVAEFLEQALRIRRG